MYSAQAQALAYAALVLALAPAAGGGGRGPAQDFERWRPLTGRGDPLRNDPTYDYEPPPLDRVRYWPDERERRPLRSADVLLLGVAARRPPAPRYPDAVLVPPPPPAAPEAAPPPATPPALPSSFYALQKSNLIYQSSSTQGWRTPNASAGAVEHAAWAPSAAPAEHVHNFISDDGGESSQLPYAFYKPKLSEAPPPSPDETSSSAAVSTFLPTPPPSTPAVESPAPSAERTTSEAPAASSSVPPDAIAQSEELSTSTPETASGAADMLGPMMSMPLGISEPQRPADGLYALASENVQIYDEPHGGNGRIQIALDVRAPTGSDRVSYVGPQGSRAPLAQRVRPQPAPMHLIIQGHSKVKTYGSKPRAPPGRDALSVDVAEPPASHQVRHLHTKKAAEELDTSDVSRRGAGGSARLQSLVESGRGAIAVQEADVGIAYDVSDGAGVPAHVYAARAAQM